MRLLLYTLDILLIDQSFNNVLSLEVVYLIVLPDGSDVAVDVVYQFGAPFVV